MPDPPMLVSRGPVFRNFRSLLVRFCRNRNYVRFGRRILPLFSVESMTLFRVFVVLVASVVLWSCSSTSDKDLDRQGKDARDEDSLFSTKSYNSSPLAVPPDLLESSSEKVQSNKSKAGLAGQYQVLPEVIGATIKSDDGRSWLEIDADVEVVWRKLVEFWAYQEISLVEFSPESGLMETDWFVKTGNNSAKGFGTVVKDLFNTYTARSTAVDKFNIRLERDDSTRTRLFVTHRNKEKISSTSNKKVTDYEWVETGQDPEKIAQLLRTIMLLFGQDDSGTA